MRVLIVEDDPKVARFVARVLDEEGYAVDVCASGADAIAQGTAGRHDLLVLDWMLPDADGPSVCRALRRAGSRAAILMLTARGEVRERVQGLEAGADDYLVKPFDGEEFVARVRALARRASGFAVLRCGALEIDRVGRVARLAGAPLDLTTREFALLAYLAARADSVVERAELLAEVWDVRFDPGSNRVEVQVSRLRDKLGAHAWMIETARGVGYCLRTSPGA